MTNIYIKASDLAALAGMHAYQPVEAAQERLRTHVFSGHKRAKEVESIQRLPSMNTAQVFDTARDMNVQVPKAVEASKRAHEASLENVRLVQTHHEMAQTELERLKLTETTALEAIQESKRQGKTVPVKETKHLDKIQNDVRAQHDRVQQQQSIVETAQAEEETTKKRRHDAEERGASQVKVSIVDEVQRRAMSVATGASKSVSAPDILAGCAEQHTRMALGTVQEVDILELLKQRRPEFADCMKPSTREIENVFIGSIVLDNANRKVYVRGVCDAISKSPRYIIEIKRRNKKLFHIVPMYERVQLECYLRMYGYANGLLVEYFSGETECHPVVTDDDLWKNICDSTLKNISCALTNVEQ